MYAVNYHTLVLIVSWTDKLEQLLFLPQVKTLNTPASSGRAPAEVTQIAVGRSDSHQIAVGHADGTVCLRLLTKDTKSKMFHTTSALLTQAEHHCMYSKSLSHIQK